MLSWLHMPYHSLFPHCSILKFPFTTEGVEAPTGRETWLNCKDQKEVGFESLSADPQTCNHRVRNNSLSHYFSDFIGPPLQTCSDSVSQHFLVSVSLETQAAAPQRHVSTKIRTRRKREETSESPHLLLGAKEAQVQKSYYVS